MEKQQNYDITAFDGTRLQVLKEKDKTALSKSALWIRRGGPSDKPVVLIDYRSSESGETIKALLEGTSGYLVCDAAPSFITKPSKLIGSRLRCATTTHSESSCTAVRHMKSNRSRPKLRTLADY